MRRVLAVLLVVAVPMAVGGTPQVRASAIPVVGAAPEAEPVTVAQVPEQGAVGPVRIHAVHMNARGPLGIGDTLVITMQGTRGGHATFDIARLERGIPMTEGPAGRYTGRRTIRRGEAAADALITVFLRRGQYIVGRKVDRIMVDGFPPEFTARIPENTEVPDNHPRITVEYLDRGPSGVNPRGVRAWINGRPAQEVRATERAASFVSREPVPAGRVYAQVRIEDRARNEATTSWWFVVDRPVPVPTVVPPNPKPSPAPTAIGDAPVPVPTVVPPNPKPSPVPTVIAPVPVPTRVPPNPKLSPPPVSVATPAPEATSRPAPEATSRPTPQATAIPPNPGPPGATRPTPRPAAAEIPPPTITVPRTGDRVGTPLTVRGTGQPGFAVLVTIEIAGSSPSEAVNLGPLTVQVAPAGTWELSVALPPGRERQRRVTITAVTIGPSGARSGAVRVTVTASQEGDRP